MRSILNVINADHTILSILPKEGEKTLSGFYYIYSNEPRSSADVLVLHYRELRHLLSCAELQYIPFIVYGKSTVITRAFSLGASDFIRIPFELQELEARAARLISSNSFVIKDKRLSFSNSHIKCGDSIESLSDSEYRILSVLCANPQRVVSRDSLNYRLGIKEDRSRVLDVHINSLRNKISHLTENSEYGKFAILTVRGRGYTVNSQISCG